MEVSRDTFLERLYRAYSSSYDITELALSELPMTALAHCHIDEDQYLLSKNAVMTHYNNDEYVYFFSLPQLTAELYNKCVDYAYQDGMARINPDDHHMCTRIVALFLCDSADADAVKRLKQCRIYKSFQFSLKGWMEFHTAAVDLGKESVVSNQYGRETAKFLKSALNPKARKRGGNSWSILKQMLQ